MSRPSNKHFRHQRIIAELAASPTVRISQLAGAFGVSAETVRRDIDELTRRGLVDRTYGGAAARHIGMQPAFGERDRLAVAERARIARTAAALVKPGDVVMIDSGSTTTQFARALAARAVELTVITNSFGVATALVDMASIRVVICPGDFSARERGVYGPETIAFLGRFYADVVFIGASGLVPAGPTDVESKACWVKRTMLARAPRRTLLVDASKFGRRHFELVCPIAELTDLVTDRAPGPRLAEALQTAKTALHLADDGELARQAAT
jgi:DeoR/GlpR family transcriptional regulator of sugar metabolism